MVEISLDTTIVRGSDHVEAEMAGQTVMMSIARGKYFALEGTAQRIWELAAEPVSVKAIIDRLVEEYDVDRETCAREVTSFVRELLDNDLITERPR